MVSVSKLDRSLEKIDLMKLLLFLMVFIIITFTIVFTLIIPRKSSLFSKFTTATAMIQMKNRTKSSVFQQSRL